MTDDREQHIIGEAGKVFMRLGIRSVNMDDIAQHLRISKKTLYQYVKDKNELVGRVVGCTCACQRDTIGAIQATGLNAIDECLEIGRFIAGEVAQMHPSIHFDLQKYHPEVWDLLQRTKQADIMGCVTDNMAKGIAEGLYREDLNIPVVARIHIARFDVAFNGELFPVNEHRFEDVVRELFLYHLRGIASKKGHAYLEKKLTKERKTA